MSPAEVALDGILRLAAAARVARQGALWRTDPKGAMERHADACEAVWAELDRLVGERGISAPGPVHGTATAKTISKTVTARLRAELPGIVARIVEDEMAAVERAV